MCYAVFAETKGGNQVKFQLEIDQTKPETVVVTAHRRSELTDRIEALVNQAAGEDHLQAFTEDDWLILKYEDIEYIMMENGKTFAVDGKGESYRLRQRLYELEEMLPAYFIRISKSALANEKHLVRFSAGFSGAVDAVFRCGRKESVSRRCFAEIKRRYNDR